MQGDVQVGRGLAIYLNIDLDEAGVVVKASRGKVYGWYMYNNNAATSYVKLYNKATAADENDTPAMTIGVPNGPSGANVFSSGGIEFSTGISARATTGVANDDVGGPTANDVVINLLYL